MYKYLSKSTLKGKRNDIMDITCRLSMIKPQSKLTNTSIFQ